MDPGVGGGVRVLERGPRRPWPLPPTCRQKARRPTPGWAHGLPEVPPPVPSAEGSPPQGWHLPDPGECWAPRRATSTSGDAERFLVTEAAANRYSVFCFVWFPLLSKRKTQGNTIIRKASWGLRNEWGSFGESTSLIFQLMPSLGCV